MMADLKPPEFGFDHLLHDISSETGFPGFACQKGTGQNFFVWEKLETVFLADRSEEG
jgi:hypothetical protein